MITKELGEHLGRIMTTYASFTRAIERAGGMGISWDRLNKMTAAELIILIGSNDIIFVWEPPVTTNKALPDIGDVDFF